MACLGDLLQIDERGRRNLRGENRTSGVLGLEE